MEQKLMWLNNLALPRCQRDICFNFPSLSTILSNSSASEHELAHLLYVTNFSNAQIPDSTIASLPQKYGFKAGLTYSNLSLSLISFSNLPNTHKFGLVYVWFLRDWFLKLLPDMNISSPPLLGNFFFYINYLSFREFFKDTGTRRLGWFLYFNFQSA